jgi:hypothetical protein
MRRTQPLQTQTHPALLRQGTTHSTLFGCRNTRMLPRLTKAVKQNPAAVPGGNWLRLPTSYRQRSPLGGDQ